MLYSIIELPKIGDRSRGFLSFAESKRSIPFEIKRVFFVYGMEDLAATRGGHAHKRLKEVFFCLHGKATFSLFDGKESETVILDQPEKGLFVGPMVWRMIEGFSPGTVILSLASEYHDEEDYITDYEEFIRSVDRP